MSILPIIAYTVTESSPPRSKRILFINRYVILITACRAKVTKPREDISFRITPLNLKWCQLIFNSDRVDRKNQVTYAKQNIYEMVDAHAAPCIPRSKI